MIKIKKHYWILLLISFLLVACSTNKMINKEELSTKVVENQSKVESYHALINLDTLVKESSSGDILQESQAFSDVTINEKTYDNFGKTQSDNGKTKFLQEYYSIGDEAYLKINDEPWVDASFQQVEYFHNDNSFYPNLVPIVEILSKMADLEETNKEYILKFSGESTDVYQSFETPYSLQFGNVDPKDIHQEITVVIDKENFFIQTIENTLSVKVSGNDLEIYIKHAYDNINNTDDFVIPQEVIDKVKE